MPIPKVKMECAQWARYLTGDDDGIYEWSHTPDFDQDEYGDCWLIPDGDDVAFERLRIPFPIITDMARLKIVEIEHANTSG